MSDTSVCTKNSRYASFFRPEKAARSRFFDAKKMPLQHPLDAIIMLTFFDAVVIAIATCSYRDDNMMLSTCVHVAINLANATYLLHKQNTRKKGLHKYTETAPSYREQHTAHSPPQNTSSSPVRHEKSSARIASAPRTAQTSVFTSAPEENTTNCLVVTNKALPLHSQSKKNESS